ncbi:hypothetical protein QBC36DRAFT_385239 [Triangularia setosa]|uniref:Uncharacterized protein n=1 Tax=Triangularia setosa TaxID=2587417 RepID=A0AAN6WCN3_9PEZI|nr:hypothetical protein QBC36DRAFT_385239 [Podospora setosa]
MSEESSSATTLPYTSHCKQDSPTCFAHSYKPVQTLLQPPDSTAMLSMQPYQISLPTFCPCCSAAISPMDLTTNPPSSYIMTIYQQQPTMTTPIQSQSPAMVSSLPPTRQQQSAMAALCRLTPEQEMILREHVTPVSVMQALDIAQESEKGAMEPTIVKIITDAYNKIWNKIATRPDLYLMTQQEFTVFNYFQSCWPDKEIAKKAVARYWANPWAFETAANRGRS